MECGKRLCFLNDLDLESSQKIQVEEHAPGQGADIASFPDRISHCSKAGNPVRGWFEGKKKADFPSHPKGFVRLIKGTMGSKVVL